jgi:hypothetical protein
MSKLIAVRIPDDLVAKMEGRKISEVVIAALRMWVEANASPNIQERKGSFERVKAVDITEVLSLSRIGCKSCGSLGGLHQKGCKA